MIFELYMIEKWTNKHLYLNITHFLYF